MPTLKIPFRQRQIDAYHPIDSLQRYGQQVLLQTSHDRDTVGHDPAPTRFQQRFAPFIVLVSATSHSRAGISTAGGDEELLVAAV
jgi:hypothetical protein